MGKLNFSRYLKTSLGGKMNFSLVLLLVTVLAAASARPSDFDLDVEHQWEMFKAHHPKIQHLTEESVRKELFKKVHRMITDHNKGNHSYTMAHNMFSDMSEEEKAGYMGLKLPEDLEVSEWTPATEVDSRVPSSLDWRTDSCLQPIKNQGQCGSWWAATPTIAVARVAGTTMLGNTFIPTDRTADMNTPTLLPMEAADTTLVPSML